jgi:adenylosuccinate lyase
LTSSDLFGTLFVPDAIREAVSDRAWIAAMLEFEAWHTSRACVAEPGAVLSLAAGTLEKVAHDVTLLAQTEVAEVVEPAGDGRGSSSTLPHKRNPVGSVLAIASARRVRGEVSILLAAMAQEHERAAGAWQAEWQAVTGALAHTGGAAAAVREVLEGLEVRPDRMRENLELTGGLVLAEAVSVALGERIGRSEAHEIVEAASRRPRHRTAALSRGTARRRGDPLAPLAGRPRPRARRRRICGPGRGARRAGPEALPGVPAPMTAEAVA